MCGRFILETPWDTVRSYLRLTRPNDIGRNVGARYNIAPTQNVLLVHAEGTERHLKDGKWWLVPHWAKEVSYKFPTFNARSETVTEKPSFRDAFKQGRCLVPASGYWEWLARSKTDKAPFCHHLPDWEPFAFAALWTHNKHVDLISCTIITAEADPAVAHVHKRMPVILKNENHDSWLDPDTTSEQALSLLQGHRGGDLLTYEAEKAVNSAHNEGQDLLKPVQQAI